MLDIRGPIILLNYDKWKNNLRLRMNKKLVLHQAFFFVILRFNLSAKFADLKEMKKCALASIQSYLPHCRIKIGGHTKSCKGLQMASGLHFVHPWPIAKMTLHIAECLDAFSKHERLVQDCLEI